MTKDLTPFPFSSTVLAVGLGLIVPAMASGRATLQALAGICLIVAVAEGFRDRALFDGWREKARSSTGKLALLAFAGLSVGIFVSSDPQRSFEAWSRTAVFLGAVVLFHEFLKREWRRQWLTERSLAGGALAMIFIALVGVAGFPWPLKLIKGELGMNNPYWAAGTVKAFAAMLACAIPALALIAWRRGGHWRTVCVTACLGAGAIILIANNKSALAGMLAMIVFCTFLIALRRRGPWFFGWFALAISTTAATFWIITILPEPPPSVAVWDWLPTWLIDSHRQQIWHFTAQKIAEAPWLGWGLNVIDRVPGADEIIAGYRVQYLPSHPHNWVLEILSESGVVGFLPTLLALIWFYAGNVQRYVAECDEAALAQIGLGCVFWGSALFNFSIWSAWWLIGYLTLSSIIAGARHHFFPSR